MQENAEKQINKLAKLKKWSYLYTLIYCYGETNGISRN
jgi:hypothetical protein